MKFKIRVYTAVIDYFRINQTSKIKPIFFKCDIGYLIKEIKCDIKKIKNQNLFSCFITSKVIKTKIKYKKRQTIGVTFQQIYFSDSYLYSIIKKIKDNDKISAFETIRNSAKFRLAMGKSIKRKYLPDINLIIRYKIYNNY